jgi:hypothetical protein
MAMSRTAKKIVTLGTLVYSHAYVRPEVGRAGCDRVHRLDGQFAVWTLDDGIMGPFDSFEEALDEADLLFVSEFATEITAPEMTADQVAARLYGEPQADGLHFRINGEEWVYRVAGGFRQVGSPTEES